MKVSLKMAAMAAGTIIVSTVLFSCSNSQDFSGVAPSIPESQSVIIFRDTGGEAEVIFTHLGHAEYWNDNCLACHSHKDVRGDTGIWECGSAACHPTDDAVGSCYDTTEHGVNCMSAQCFECHRTEALAPQPDECARCHMTLSTGAFLDSAVEGLKYETDSQKDKRTGPSGDLEFRTGETITFSLNSTVLGSATAQGIITPVDLVPGASDETDPTVTNIARLLMSLDDDGDPDNGIRILDQVHIAVQGRNLALTADSTTFATNPDLVGPPGGLLRELNSVFIANTPRALVSSATAQAHLGSTLDSIFPSSTRIVGAPNTRFLLYGSHAVSGGTSYQYQWYRANNPSGVGMAPILSATAQTYQLVDPDDVGKYLSFEVVPSSGGSIGTPSRSKVAGPVTDTMVSSVTAYGVIDTRTTVDQYSFNLAGSGDVTIDVRSYEAFLATPDFYHGGWDPCGSSSCHHHYYSEEMGTTKLDFPPDGPSNGYTNDRLLTNVYLFNSSGSVIDYQNCEACGDTWDGTFWDCDNYCGVPTLGYSRSYFNPYLDATLSAGDYQFSVGAAGLSSTNARAGVNSGGATWLPRQINTSPWTDGYEYYENYKIIFTFP
jgi:hypothetical protein